MNYAPLKKKKMNKTPFKRCIMVLADGARHDLMEQLLQSGELKNTKEFLVRPGSFRKGVTVFPSTTGPAYLPFLMGCFPGTMNVTGVRWFEKKKNRSRSYCGIETFCMPKDMTPGYKTLWEILPRAYSIFSSVFRGPAKSDLTRFMRIWYVYYAHLTDRWSFIDETATKKMLRALETDFQFLFVVLPGIDEHSHLAHPKHDSTVERYRFLDQTIGTVVEKLKKQGKREETLLWVFSDHGLSKTDTHFCVNEFLQNHGIPPLFYPKILHRKGKTAVNMMSGNGMTHLYFKGEHGWNEDTPRSVLEKRYPNLLKDFLKEKAVDLLLVRNSSGGVDILSKRGEASLWLRGDSVEYQVKSSDPFGYSKLPSLMKEEEALRHTAETMYPDALWQIAHLFKASRTG